MKWLLRVLVAVLLIAVSVYAFAFLVLLSATLAPATYKIETREIHPDYVFVLRTEIVRFDASGWKPLAEVRLVEITPGEPLTIEFDPFPKEAVEGSAWREAVCLSIVPRAVAARYKTAAEYDEAGSPIGVRKCFGSGTAVPPWYNINEQLTVTYRVQPKRSGDGLEIVKTSWSPLWQWGFVSGGVLLCGVVWAVKRSRRSAPTPSAS